jgi:hypothetical protein
MHSGNNKSLTKSMAQRILKTDSCSHGQEIPCVLLNTKLHYRVHKNLQVKPGLSQFNPIHIFTPYF